jgi:hypothetical protein
MSSVLSLVNIQPWYEIRTFGGFFVHTYYCISVIIPEENSWPSGQPLPGTAAGTSHKEARHLSNLPKV